MLPKAAAITSLRQKIVFVDPDDSSCPFWWPALIVPSEFLHLFPAEESEDLAAATSSSANQKQDLLVVCYFEDASFSLVPHSAVKPFHLESELYLKYRSDPLLSTSFLQDRAVVRAIKFLTEGAIPQSFGWLLGDDNDDDASARETLSNSSSSSSKTANSFSSNGQFSSLEANNVASIQQQQQSIAPPKRKKSLSTSLDSIPTSTTTNAISTLSPEITFTSSSSKDKRPEYKMISNLLPLSRLAVVKGILEECQKSSSNTVQ